LAEKDVSKLTCLLFSRTENLNLINSLQLILILSLIGFENFARYYSLAAVIPGNPSI